MTCSIEGCEKPTEARGWCLKHYKTWYRNGSPTKMVREMHGLHGSREYSIWVNMRSRCKYPSMINYERYGGRGITVCERWEHSFEAFYADMGPCPTPQHSLDRINNAGNYEPDNCKWATLLEQANNKRNNRVLSVAGLTMTLPSWCRLLKLNYGTVMGRLRRGWPESKALELTGETRRARA